MSVLTFSLSVLQLVSFLSHRDEASNPPTHRHLGHLGNNQVSKVSCKPRKFKGGICCGGQLQIV